MPKIGWVALPLIAAGAWLLWQWLRRRPLSRHGLNVGSSLLLLGYVGTTAGLGVFWVANQQLPVFDWHYLFGYATLLLLALHLTFNWRVVWRFLTGRGRAPAAVAARETPRRRRIALTLLGAFAAGSAGFGLGWRGARDAQPGRRAAGTQAGDLDAQMAEVERFHAQSSNSRAGVLLRAPGVDWGDAPPQFKRYAQAPTLSLAPAAVPPAGAAFDRATLGALLWHTAGVTAERGTLRLRAAPSSGALFSTELYVALDAAPGLDAGIWHYDALTPALERLEGGPDVVAELRGAAADDDANGAVAIVVATSVFRRSGVKYRDRTYRYVLADLGHALENLRAAALALGLAPRFAQRFDEARCAAALGVDEAEEGVLAWVALRPRGAASTALPGAARRTHGDAALRASAASAARPALPARDVPPVLGITAAIHAATSLRSETAVRAQRPAPAPDVDAVALPRVAPARGDVLRVIAARRSIRRFSGAPLELVDLAGVLGAMRVAQTQPLSEALHVDVVAHAVAGLAPGAYRYFPRRHALAARRAAEDLRSAARGAALDQDVIGDAAAVIVLGVDRAALRADPNGALRGYRHALLEAGCMGERVYLEAGARGLAACAVGAFYDDEAAALVAADPVREWVVHFIALGIAG